MTVRELIEELEEYPMDLPVIMDFKEIEHINVVEGAYYLVSENHYCSSDAVVLE